MSDIYCPWCEIDFEGEMWDNGNCPTCKREYFWECWYNKYLNDEDITIEWKDGYP